MGLEILISVRPGWTRVASVQDGDLIDIKIERPGAPTAVGSIFKGEVSRVLPGMQAAFVDIGLPRAAFLYVGDILGDANEEPQVFLEEAAGSEVPPPKATTHPPIEQLIHEGQSLFVQVAKDPVGSKGARITTQLSLAGRYLVLLPTLKHFGVSRRIEELGERQRLLGLVADLKPQHGLIVRTAGEGATAAALKEDLIYLDRLWAEVEQQYARRKSPGLVHSEMDVELRVLRDLLSESVARVVVDDPATFKKIVSFVQKFLPTMKDQVELYKGTRPLFDHNDLEIAINQALARRVWLKSGGYLVFDEAEALVVVDVNTGRFVGKKDFEETILTTNIEAAKEICHQVRLRNFGGIIIIDFIDMEKAAHRDRVLAVLREELKKDPARTDLTSMSALGLVELTRKRARPSLQSLLCEPCPYCEGNGFIKRKMTVAHEILRQLESWGGGRPAGGEGLVVRCHGSVADWIYEEEAEALDRVEKKLGRPIAFKVEPDYHVEHFLVEPLPAGS